VQDHARSQKLVVPAQAVGLSVPVESIKKREWLFVLEKKEEQQVRRENATVPSNSRVSDADVEIVKDSQHRGGRMWIPGILPSKVLIRMGRPNE
jgi:hypothetical protein